MNRRILVTGANGFIGSHLVKRLRDDGHEVLAMVRPQANLERLSDVEGIQFLYTDMAGIVNQAKESILEFQADAAFHLAWWGGNSNSFVNDPRQIFENIPGSIELLRLLVLGGVRRFIGFGTCVEYGHFEIPTAETLKPHPQNLYGSSKLQLGILLETLCQKLGISFAWVRPFWLFGEKDDPNRLIPYVISHYQKSLTPQLTPGEQLWDYLYIEDAIDALISLLENSQAIGKFNLASGQVHSLRTVVEFIYDQMCPTVNVGLGSKPYPQGQIMHLQADISKLCNAVKWQPRYNIWQGLERTIEASKLTQRFSTGQT